MLGRSTSWRVGEREGRTVRLELGFWIGTNDSLIEGFMLDRRDGVIDCAERGLE